MIVLSIAHVRRGDAFRDRLLVITSYMEASEHVFVSFEAQVGKNCRRNLEPFVHYLVTRHGRGTGSDIT